MGENSGSKHRAGYRLRQGKVGQGRAGHNNELCVSLLCTKQIKQVFQLPTSVFSQLCFEGSETPHNLNKERQAISLWGARESKTGFRHGQRARKSEYAGRTHHDGLSITKACQQFWLSCKCHLNVSFSKSRLFSSARGQGIKLELSVSPRQCIFSQAVTLKGHPVYPAFSSPTVTFLPGKLSKVN